ncbi:diguanylate cyclase [Aestuariibacter halophilus]|uniref:diguanylate cyclase n=1 Tax=Fluctibacter halophilus TaxID=226011 RepID=A0ABS8GC18_9ALTE|nr:diguanylate cyclase [Aestuariibacter halophilus]MCC2617943.1 diguanylate cyclase [Aestuariibacter halophilus]
MPRKKSQPVILAVDDEQINLRIIGQGLSEDYRVIMADTGKRAIELACEEKPDLVLLDIRLPDMSGYTVLKSLKNHPDTKSIPIIFVTGQDSDENEVKGLRMGAADYFTKPIKMPLARARIAKQLELKHKTDLLESLVDMDGLTDIPNRRSFDKRFEEEWRRAKRHGKPLGICMADIDYFKQYNDKYGHAVGDDALISVAGLLAKVAKRAGDFVARYGGEEFVMLLPESDEKATKGFVQKLIENLSHLAIPHEYSDCAEHVTLSFGAVVVVPEKGMDKMAALEAADEQLYAAKSAGRNRLAIRRFEPQPADTAE